MRDEDERDPKTGRGAEPGVRLRRKASAKVLQKPRRYRDILDRVAMDEAKTLRAIGRERLAGAFLRAYAERYGERTTNVVAMQLEYPR